ncbi:MAG: hypothetical protein IJP66_00270 [Kiritimatiellae bacterium]|nr:hypothetical protein [Kiritimatiellia bacterium]
MELTQEQKAAVGRWVEDGAKLSDVQRRIQDEFGIQLTYMDVRFLVLDIGATPKDKPEPAAQSAAPAAAMRAAGDGDDPASAPFAAADSGDSASVPCAAGDGGDPADPFAPAGGAVSVELDKIVRAGAAMSGSVTFSDGVTGSWILDAYGRLGLTKVSKPGYQPSAADLSAFQLELQRKLGY